MKAYRKVSWFFFISVSFCLCFCERLFAVRSAIFNSHFTDFYEGVLSWSRANKCPLTFGRNGIIKNEHFFSWLIVSTTSISRCVAFSFLHLALGFFLFFLNIAAIFFYSIFLMRAHAFHFHSLFHSPFISEYRCSVLLKSGRHFVSSKACNHCQAKKT